MKARSPTLPALLMIALLITGIATDAQSTAPVQESAAASDFEPLMAQGRQLFAANDVDGARTVLERALTAAEAATSIPQQARALVTLAEVEFRADRPQRAKELAERALEFSRGSSDRLTSGRAHFVLGSAAESVGQFAEARTQFDTAVAELEQAGDPRRLALALLESFSAAPGSVHEREPRYLQAVRHAAASGDKGVEASVLHAWGDQLFASGDNESALEKYQMAAPLFEQAGSLVSLGTIYNSLGRLYRRHGQIEVALDYQHRALRIHEKAGVPFTLMQSLNAVGVTYQALGRSREAVPYLERALVLARQSGNRRTEDFVAANFVSSLFDQGAHDEIVRVLTGVIERGLDQYRSTRLGDLALAYLRLGRHHEALQTADRALDECRALEDLACILALDTRAAAQLALGRRAEALADLKKGVDAVEQARARLVPADFYRQQFGRSEIRLFNRTIEMQLSDALPREALETAERARSRAFLDLLASRGIGASKTATPPTATDLVGYAARLDSTLVLYWVTADRVFIWTVLADGNVHASTVPVRESRLVDLIRATAPGTGSGTGKPAPRDTAVTAWRSLYDLLIQPIRATLPRSPGALVTIVPHGPLAMLSFAALQDHRSRYLIEDYTLHYLPTAAMLEFTQIKRQRAARSSETLVVADPLLPRRSPLDRPLLGLPGAREEARAISRLAPPDSMTILQGEGATEAAVRAKVAGKGVLHFATHAIVSDDDPFSSFLALGRSEGGASSDGTLTAQEVYDLRLQADLVVLSACRSGGGRLTGDGLATFARAFIAAGAPSLITSVFDVADEATAHLIPGFYREWRGGASKAHALRNAQLSFLRRLRNGTLKVDTAAGPVVLPEHPALWAGFTLIGEP